MSYLGLQEQIRRNNRKSILLLIAFPLLVLLLVFAFLWITNYWQAANEARYYGYDISNYYSTNLVVDKFLMALPWVVAVVAVWFTIAYFSNTTIINRSTHSKSIGRKENMRIYNLVENLCMSVGMKMPQLRIIQTDALNAFASGINEKTYTLTLTSAIIDKLDDKELEGVIAHELTHIRNNDVRLMIVSIVFVGIFSFLISILLRNFFYGFGFGFGNRRSKNNGRGQILIMVLIMILAALGYLLSVFFKMALSRKREYLADSGAVEMTKDSLALASALEKISGNDQIKELKSDEVKQMFISNSPKKRISLGLNSLFSTHPPIEKRIAFLRQL